MLLVTPVFGTTFYLTLALMVALLGFLWRWFLQKPARSSTETFFVMLISVIGVAPLLFVLYLVFVRGR
jgi:hypothetical protein